MGNPLGNDKGGMATEDKRMSAKMNTSTGSGSRPGTSRFVTPVSHPMNPRTLDRGPFGSEPLGGTKTSKQGD